MIWLSDWMYWIAQSKKKRENKREKLEITKTGGGSGPLHPFLYPLSPLFSKLYSIIPVILKKWQQEPQHNNSCLSSAYATALLF